MRRVLECGVFVVPGGEAWVAAWCERVVTQEGVRWHVVNLAEGSMVDQSGGGQSGLSHSQGVPAHCVMSVAPAALGRLSPVLQRFDFCILPVNYANLSWARLALAWYGHAGAVVPLIGLIDGLRAPAIQDLLMLGLHDFIQAPASQDEFLARVRRLPRRPSVEVSGAPGMGLDGNPPMPESHVLVPGVLAVRGSRAGLPGNSSQETALPLLNLCGIAYSRVPFQEAKRQVVGVFEREYVNVALEVAGGNVAAAARSVNKHRRAFWSLMRKHGVDAQRYRDLANTKVAYDAARKRRAPARPVQGSQAGSQESACA